MAVIMTAFWDNIGTVIPPGDAEYVVAEQPIAEYDNWFNYEIASDMQKVIDDIINKFNANTILKADTNNTPAALTVGTNTIVGRAAGSISALTATEVRTIINVENGANVTDSTNVNAAGAVMEEHFDATTFLYATSDHTPQPKNVAETLAILGVASGAEVNLFEEVTNVLREKSASGYDNDFVIGSPQLADDGNTAHDSRMWFDKGKSAYRAGTVSGTEWDDANVGMYSHAWGRDLIASGQHGYAYGYCSSAYMYGQSAYASGHFSVHGDAQRSTVTLRCETTSAVLTSMTINGTSPVGANCMALPANRTWAFTITISARQTSGSGTIGDSGIYKIEGGVKRDGSNNTALVGVITKTVLAEDQSAWDVTAEADDSNDWLVVKVTGEASKTIHWVAHVNLVEVG